MKLNPLLSKLFHVRKSHTFWKPVYLIWIKSGHTIRNFKGEHAVEGILSNKGYELNSQWFNQCCRDWVNPISKWEASATIIVFAHWIAQTLSHLCDSIGKISLMEKYYLCTDGNPSIGTQYRTTRSTPPPPNGRPTDVVRRPRILAFSPLAGVGPCRLPTQWSCACGLAPAFGGNCEFQSPGRNGPNG